MLITKYSELKEKEPTWYFMEAMPSGKIENLNQYSYMIYYSQLMGFNFYRCKDGKENSSIPSFKECKGKYLDYTSWFGGAAFALTIKDKGTEWTYGKYGCILDDIHDEEKTK